MKPNVKVLIYVQHLLGVGHVFRAMRIVAALTDFGFDVELIYGGQEIEHFSSYGAKVHFLPPLNTLRGDFSRLVTENGTEADERFKDIRRARVLEILGKSSPDILITEAFPFGRRQMHFELLPLMEAAHSLPKRPQVFASIRDILQDGNKASKDRQTVELIERYFDGVLVHGDKNFTALGATFPFADEIEQKLHYTGIVAPKRTNQPVDSRDRYDVVVSAGGGLLGRELLFAAAAAKAHTSLKDARWCLLTGPYMEEGDRKTLMSSDIEVRRFIPELHSLLASAKLSVSLSGYNTIADIMVAGCRAIVAPQWNEKETEQRRRAELLAARGLVVALSHVEKTPAALADAIERVMAAPPPDWSQIDQQGAPETARILAQSLSATRT
ncbi:MAG: glycosyltransferase [Pseudomonadota bacterium]